VGPMPPVRYIMQPWWMPLLRALAKNMAASYFGKNYLTVFPQKRDLCQRWETLACLWPTLRKFIFWGLGCHHLTTFCNWKS
jgi:hypothetical protein